MIGVRGQGMPDVHAGSQQTLAAVWGLLAYLESPYNAEQVIRKHYPDGGGPYSVQAVLEAYHAAGLSNPPQPLDIADDDAVRQAALYMSTAIRHGRAYFDAVAASPTTVRPTLLYYGCLSLAKALIAGTFA